MRHALSVLSISVLNLSLALPARPQAILKKSNRPQEPSHRRVSLDLISTSSQKRHYEETALADRRTTLPLRFPGKQRLFHPIGRRRTSPGWLPHPIR